MVPRSIYVLLLGFCIELIPVVFPARNIRVQNKVPNVPGIRRAASTRKAICKNLNNSPPLRGPNLQIKPKHIPKKVLLRLSEAGANVTKCPGEGLYVIENIHFGDEAWKVFEAFAESAPHDPLISIIFCPSENFCNTFMIPAKSLVPAIVREANSIRSHYANLDIGAFAGGGVPAIPKPSAFEGLQRFNTTKLTLSKLFERIQNPNHPEYPVITALPSGSFICSVFYHWTNALLIIEVFKP
jgi:hypothetical protein